MFIEEHRGVFGIGPICNELAIAPSTYYARKAIERDPVLAWDGLCRVRDRRVRSQDCGLAGIQIDEGRVRPGRPEPGHLSAGAAGSRAG